MNAPDSKQKTEAKVDSAEFNNNFDTSEIDKGSELPATNDIPAVMGKFTCAGCVSGNCDGCPFQRMIQNQNALTNEKNNNSEFDSSFDISGGDKIFDSLEKPNTLDIVGDATDIAKKSDETIQTIEADRSELHSYMDQLLDDDVELVVADIFAKSNNLTEKKDVKKPEPAPVTINTQKKPPTNIEKHQKDEPEKKDITKKLVNNGTKLPVETINIKPEAVSYDNKSEPPIETAINNIIIDDNQQKAISEKFFQASETDELIIDEIDTLLSEPKKEIQGEIKTEEALLTFESNDEIIAKSSVVIPNKTINSLDIIPIKETIKKDEIVSIPKSDIIYIPTENVKTEFDEPDEGILQIEHIEEISNDGEIEIQQEIEECEIIEEFQGYLKIPRNVNNTDVVYIVDDVDEEEKTTTPLISNITYTNKQSVLTKKNNIILPKRLADLVLNILPVTVIY